MADNFILLERVGNGYFLKPTSGRGDTVLHVANVVVPMGAGPAIDIATTFKTADWCAVVGGFKFTGTDVGVGVWMVANMDGFWHVVATLTGALTAAGFVNVLFMDHAICS